MRPLRSAHYVHNAFNALSPWLCPSLLDRTPSDQAPVVCTHKAAPSADT